MADKDISYREFRNLRRRVDTRIKQLQKIAEQSQSTIAKRGAEQRIERLEKAKSNTYVRNSEGERIVPQLRERAFTALENELDSTRYASAQGTRNLKTTANQLNLATVADASSYYTEAEVHIFYRATQNAWQREGVSIENRNEAILEYYGYERLSELVADVLAANWRAVEKSKESKKKKQSQEQEEMADELDVKEAQESPDYMKDVIMIDDPSGLEEPEKA